MAILKTLQACADSPVSPCEILKPVAKDIQVSRKRVSFAESRNVEYMNLTVNEEECKTLWHTPYDFKKMKERTNAFAKQALKQDKIRSDDEKSYSNIILRVYDECCNAECEAQTNILSQDDQADLVYLVGKANSRTGLERVIVRELAHDKRFRRTEIVKATLKIQRQSIDMHTSHVVSELIYMTCETISRPSRIFARHLAQALEVSLRWYKLPKLWKPDFRW